MNGDESDVKRDLDALEVELKKLEAEYNMFFSGRAPRPPLETRKRVEALVKRLDREYIETGGDRFRFQSLQARFQKFIELWDRGLRAREEGRPGPFAQPPPKAAGCRWLCAPAPRLKQTRPPPAPSSSRLQLLAYDLIDQLSLRPALEAGHHDTHDLTDIFRAGFDRRAGRGPDLLRLGRRRQKFLEDFHLTQLDIRQIGPLRSAVLLVSLAADLDSLPEHLHDLVVRRIATQLELAVFDVGQNGAENEGPVFLLRLAGCVQRGPQSIGKFRHAISVARGGSCGWPRSSSAFSSHSASRSADAS